MALDASSAPAMAAAPNGRVPALKLPIIVGTRPEAIKLVPVILALREHPDYDPVVVSTGQHHRMVAEIFELAGIEHAATLYAGDNHSRLNERVATVMRRFDDFVGEVFGSPPAEGTQAAAVLRGEYPAAVLVHGDTSSAMAAALAAFHLRIPVIHVEAGLRTGGLNLTPFPEELNREVITCVAALNLAPTVTNLENLVRENVPADQIFVTGNTGIDALRWACALEVEFTDPAVAELAEGPQPIVVVTAHRRENWGHGLDGIAAGVAALARRHEGVRFVVPMHPNPAVREQLREPLGGLDNVLLTEPLRYAEFARLLGACHLVITDSGGIQEEAPSLGKPVLVARETTERTEGVEAGTLLLVGTDPERIEREGSRLLDDPDEYRAMADRVNPYGDGHAAERVVAAFRHIAHGGEPPTPFGPGYVRDAVLRAAGVRPDVLEALERAQREEHRAPAGTEMWAP
jgi:UDP-N-acetylglucosamine 2-epimerase (non-hydrolysing)